MMDCVCYSHVVPTLTLENVYTHIPGVGSLHGFTLWQHLGWPGVRRSSVENFLCGWLAGEGECPPSWRRLLYAVLRTGGSHGWEDTIKLCAPEGMPNYIPIVITYTVVLYC